MRAKSLEPTPAEKAFDFVLGSLWVHGGLLGTIPLGAWHPALPVCVTMMDIVVWFAGAKRWGESWNDPAGKVIRWSTGLLLVLQLAILGIMIWLSFYGMNPGSE